MDMIEFFLDGRKVSARPGETVLEVARRENIYIPSLCREERISKTTSCFVCVVQDVKTGRFLPSCAACPAPGQEIAVSSDAVKEMRRTALDLLLSEHCGDCEAPCKMACPAHAEVEEYVRLGKEGRFLEALEVIKKRIPLPMSVGRVCPRFCEKECRRNVTGEPVAINDFKRTAADLESQNYMETLPAETGKRVAIVGAGPAGLSAAYYLRLEGVAVTVYDMMPQPGGMLRYGIPEYRLPKTAVLDRELAHFQKLGVTFEFGRKLGENLSLDELKASYDAVVLAIGCWQASGMRCEGENLAVQGIDFLRNVAMNGNTAPNPGRVIVIGGGNTAMDCLRTAVRLGSADVNCFYRRTEAEMPAERIELEEAAEEGVQFHYLAAPVRLARNSEGRLVLTFQKMALGEPDASGRRKPVPVAGSEFDEVADTVIAAIGQSTLAPAGVPVDKRGNLAAVLGDNVFAAGDCVSGARTVVEALHSGRLAAEAAVSSLTGKVFPAENPVNVSRGSWQDLSVEDLVFQNGTGETVPREKLKFIPLEERKKSFKEVTSTMTPEQLAQEGGRCIECSCSDKHDCRLREHSVRCGARPDTITGAKQTMTFDNRHPLILQDRGKCIKCGVCVKVCSEVVNEALLSAMKRGFHTCVGTAFNQGFPAACADCGACVDACPTGALSFKKAAKRDKVRNG